MFPGSYYFWVVQNFCCSCLFFFFCPTDYLEGRYGARKRRSHYILSFGPTDHSVSYVNGTILGGRQLWSVAFVGRSLIRRQYRRPEKDAGYMTRTQSGCRDGWIIENL
ncbi:hypothetical protein BJX96DRAFT_152730 [Aspergillus floccosus]